MSENVERSTDVTPGHAIMILHECKIITLILSECYDSEDYDGAWEYNKLSFVCWLKKKDH